ncbi:MAG: hypothetical protein HYR85_17500 [Planctomycetes bacterium]|nr:hypothetical protein [Planctomycetota bacterium]
MDLRRSHLTGLFVLVAAALLLEITLVRILSFAAWYHFAFFVLGAAMLGVGASGVALACVPRLRRAAVSDGALSGCALLFAVSTLGLRSLVAALPFDPFGLATDRLQVLAVPLYLVAGAAPFFFAGLAVAFLFVRAPGEANRIYVADLVGAGIGTALVPAALGVFGGSGALALAAILGASAAPAFVAHEKRARVVTEAAILAMLALASAALPIAVTPNKPLRRVLGDPSIDLFTAWNGISRIDVLQGVDPRGNPTTRDERWVAIDGGTAMTRLPNVTQPIRDLPSDETHHSAISFATLCRREPSVLVVGSGGGYEVLTALTHGARRVVAVEINPAIADLVAGRMSGFVGGLFQDPRVTLRNEDARSTLSRLPRDERFDLILSSHTVTNAAIASGALTLGESTVLTLEAFRAEIARLSPEGMLYVTRPEFQLPRLLVSLARAADLEGAGDAPARLLVYRHAPEALPDGRVPERSFFAGCIFSKRPLEPDDEARFEASVKAQGADVVYAPSRRGPSALLARCAAASRREEVSALERETGLLLEPATDDCPFFNRHAPWSAVGFAAFSHLAGTGAGARLALEEEPITEATLIALFALALVVSALLLGIPPWLAWRRGERAPDGPRVFACFSALGLAFIATEIALVQRFAIYLGDPARALAVVVAALLVSAGLGSAFADRHAVDPRRAARAAAVGAALALLVVPATASVALPASLALPLALRIAVASLFVVPCGFLMGMPFPLSLRLLEGDMAPWIPWAWSANGFFAVIGSVLAQIGAMTFGFGAVLCAAAVIYVVAAVAIPLARLPRTMR